ncbi:MAG TPA: very short patch repair endonuclease [Gemmobacter sp.]|nr:very short patch repair endonuclease [Gemmobacter sp.]
MTDVVSPEVRSRMMAGIRGRDTQPELLLRRAMHARGFRFRLHRKDLPGSPDLVFPRYRVVVFVHGCFWHRHEGCRYTTTPKTRIDFWQAKFEANLARDQKVEEALACAGWRIAIVWECALRHDAGRIASELAEWMSAGISPVRVELGSQRKVLPVNTGPHW